MVLRSSFFILLTSNGTKHGLRLSVGHTALGLSSEEAGGAGGREGDLSQQSLSTYKDGAADRYVTLYSYLVNTALRICTIRLE